MDQSVTALYKSGFMPLYFINKKSAANTTFTAFLAGAEGFEPSARGFGVRSPSRPPILL